MSQQTLIGFEGSLANCRQCGGSGRTLIAGPVYAEWLGLPLAECGTVDLGACTWCRGSGAVPRVRDDQAAEARAAGGQPTGYRLASPDPVGTLPGPDGTVSIAIRAGGRRVWLMLTTAEARALAPELLDAAMLVEQRGW